MTRLNVLVMSGFLMGGVLGFACGGSSKLMLSGDGGVGDGGGAGSGGGSTGGGNGGTTGGGNGGTTGGGNGGTTGGTGGTAGGGMVTTPSICPTVPAQCSDGKDNDDDGKVDSSDAECVSPCDNDEGTYATGIPGDNVDACKQDCFFDGDSGQGNDGCEWNLKCDMANPGGNLPKACPYDANAKCTATQSEKCINNCRALTPNGCDCFGCCTVSVNGTAANVLLAPGCTAAAFGDPMKCPRCTPNPSCINTCGKCEVCVGKPAPDPSCPSNPTPGTGGAGGSPADGGMAGTGGMSGTGGAGGGTPPPPEPECAAGVTSCGPGGDVPATGCPSGYFCNTGCCVKFIP